eukprot:m.126740 g.126740  ORF g.126740 m.126740 type:complete len:389 (+) comp16347_c0_seq2:213-1379(+)
MADPAAAAAVVKKARMGAGRHTNVTARFGLDIGGSLTKIAYFQKDCDPSEHEADRAFREKLQTLMAQHDMNGESGYRDKHLEFDMAHMGGRIHLLRFETHLMEQFLQMVQEHDVLDHTSTIACTGGGARKYAEEFRVLLGEYCPKFDELSCLVEGINTMLQYDHSELYKVDHKTFRQTGETIPHSGDSLFPYLLVNIGSGVSILKVSADGKHERVGGTSLGGATFFGLCCLLTGCNTFDEALALADQGTASNVDLLVGDIYGGSYAEFGLSEDVVAASFGKLTRPDVRKSAKPIDMARALLDMITNNVASLALLNAHKHQTKVVVFAGNFLRRNRISIARLSFAVEYWSKGQQQALFLLHEGYLGAVGALLNHAKEAAADAEAVTATS